MDRILIVNADDFGQTEGINEGILRAYQNGIVTSASFMVRWPAAQHAAARAAGLDLGLHIDLGEWAFRDGQWIARYERVPFDDVPAIRTEVRFQLEEFRRLTGKEPSHLDSHQHVHLQKPVLSVVRNLANELDVPLRGCTPSIGYCGSFYGQTGEGEQYREAITVDSLVEILRGLPVGITELACHPGFDDSVYSTYAVERSLEVATLCDPLVRQTVRELDIRLAAFSDVLSRQG